MAILDRIKFDGMKNGREWLVYRYPGESFVAGTQLIVGEGQVAVFVKGGQALDYFTSGTYSLSTANIPLLQAVINLPFGGKTPYTAEIYFINKTTKLNMNWGTADPIQLVDPKYHIKLRTRAFGQFGMKVDDYRVFLTELIGTLSPLEVVNYGKMLDYFRGVLVMKVKSLIAQAIIHNKVSALEIVASIDSISRFCEEEIGTEFQRFGLKVVNFHIQSINFPDEDFEEINKILRDKASFEIIGDQRYATKRSFDTLETAAGNQGGATGVFTGAGVGLAAGMAMGGAMSNLTQDLSPAAPPSTGRKTCPNCGKQSGAEVIFCGDCGSRIEPERVKCPSCGEEQSATVKFCTLCGTSMVRQKDCTHCHAGNDAEAKFCKDCGKELEG